MQFAEVAQRWRTGLSVRHWRGSKATLVAVLIGVALAAGTALAAVSYAPAAAACIPVAVVLLYLVFTRARAAYVVMLCMLSLVPIEGHLFGYYVPNWTQLLVPAVLVGTVFQGVLARERRAFRWHPADVFVLGFILLGYVGIFAVPTQRQWKFFTNQEVFPALAYFMAKWLPLDRAGFLQQVRWLLLSALALGLIMLGTSLLGIDPFYHGFHWLGLGKAARGPMWTVSDTVAYSALWAPLFLYAAATGLPLLGGLQRRVWPAALGVSLAATAATTERSGFLALAVALAVCALHPRLRKPVVICLVAALAIVPLWVSTGIGGRVHGRLQTLGEEGAGFERTIYRQKALDYIASPYWNPAVGTGFGRLNKLSRKTMPEEEWVYDYNWESFRLVTDFAARPTHCAPVTVLGEFGYGGVACLLGLAACVGFAFARGRALAREQERRYDSALVVAALASLGTVMANGWYHNTEGVVEVLFVLWSFAGTMVGHPEAMVDTQPASRAPDAGRLTGPRQSLWAQRRGRGQQH